MGTDEREKYTCHRQEQIHLTVATSGCCVLKKSLCISKTYKTENARNETECGGTDWLKWWYSRAQTYILAIRSYYELVTTTFQIYFYCSF
jgi:hypothetical protein